MRSEVSMRAYAKRVLGGIAVAAALALVAYLSVLAATGAAQAVPSPLYSQPPTGGVLTIQSSQIGYNRFGSDYDQYVWDDFTLAQTAVITGVTWRGAYHTGGNVGGGVTDFWVAIYASTAADTQPDVLGTPLTSFYVGNNANETPPWTTGSVVLSLHDYSATFPTPFTATVGVKYWLQIVGIQSGPADWGMAAGSGGSGGNFYAVPGVGDFVYRRGVGDAAFTLWGPGNGGPIVASIVVAPNPANVPVGGSQQFTATGYTGTGEPLVITPTWSTDAGTIFNGQLNAQTVAGSRYVTATIGSVAGAAVVNLLPGPAITVSLAPKQVTLAPGANYTFTASARDTYGNLISPLSLTWTVTPTAVGSIDATGLFTAGSQLGSYPAAVKVASGVISATASITIAEGAPDHIVVTPAPAAVLTGKNIRFTARAYDSVGNAVGPQSFTWRVSAPAAGVIDASGVFTAGNQPGSYPAAVQASGSGITGTADVQVLTAWPTELYLPETLRGAP